MLLLPLLLRWTKTSFSTNAIGQEVHENDEKANKNVH
jgi:hypothetical protein